MMVVLRKGVLSPLPHPIASFLGTTLSPAFHIFVPDTVGSQDSSPHRFPTPISSGYGPQRDERRRMFACKPDPTFGTALAKGFDVLVQMDFAFFVPFVIFMYSVSFFVRQCRISVHFPLDVAVAAFPRGADLEIGITAPSRELIMLPIRTKDLDWLTARRGRVVISQERVVRVKERGERGVVLRRAELERRDQRRDVRRAGTIEIE